MKVFKRILVKFMNILISRKQKQIAERKQELIKSRWKIEELKKQNQQMQ